MDFINSIFPNAWAIQEPMLSPLPWPFLSSYKMNICYTHKDVLSASHYPCDSGSRTLGHLVHGHLGKRHVLSSLSRERGGGVGLFSFGQWAKTVPETMVRTQPFPFEVRFMTTPHHSSATGLRPGIRAPTLIAGQISLHSVETSFPTGPQSLLRELYQRDLIHF